MSRQGPRQIPFRDSNQGKAGGPRGSRSAGAEGSPAAAREFPARPLVGVGGVVIHRGRVLLVRRGRAPLKGQWSLPGGLVEAGEELRRALRRELREETSLEVKPTALIGVFERIERDQRRSRAGGQGCVRYHYIILDYACRYQAGRLRPASDVSEARWVLPAELAEYRPTAEVRRVILEAIRLSGATQRTNPVQRVALKR